MELPFSERRALNAGVRSVMVVGWIEGGSDVEVVSWAVDEVVSTRSRDSRALLTTYLDRDTTPTSTRRILYSEDM